MAGGLAPRRRRATVRRRVAKLSKPVVKAIQRVVKRGEETKYVANAYDASGSLLNNVFYITPNIPNVGAFYPAIPKLTQGTDDYQRVGNKVQPTSVSVSLKIGFNSQDISANELLCVVYYGVSKTEKTWQNANPLPTAAILDNGNGTNSSFGGSRFDLFKPLDKKLITARRKVFKLSKTQGALNQDVVPGAQGGGFSTSLGRSFKSMLLKFRAPKHLMYDTANQTYPTNFAPWYAIGFCHADGSPTVANDDTLVNVSSKSHMWFKDA